MNRRLRSLVIAVGVLTPVLAAGQRAMSDPADPALRVPPPSESVFAHFRRFEEIAPADWLRVNQEVAGETATTGHGGHAGTSVPPSAKEANPAPTSPPAPPMRDHMGTGGDPGSGPKP